MCFSIFFSGAGCGHWLTCLFFSSHVLIPAEKVIRGRSFEAPLPKSWPLRLRRSRGGIPPRDSDVANRRTPDEEEFCESQ